jgi:hypothetical protein
LLRVKFSIKNDEDAEFKWPLSKEEHAEMNSPANNIYTVKLAI